MSVIPNSGNGKITVPDLLQRKTPAAGSHPALEAVKRPRPQWLRSASAMGPRIELSRQRNRTACELRECRISTSGEGRTRS